jgi:hypothetical protein
MLNPIINCMENHPRLHEQATPDPLHEPVTIFVEGMDITPPRASSLQASFPQMAKTHQPISSKTLTLFLLDISLTGHQD